MRKRYAVIVAQREKTPQWWTELRAADPEQMPDVLREIRLGKDNTGRIDERTAEAALAWAQSLMGWWGVGAELLTKRGEPLARPLVMQTVYAEVARTESGLYAVYRADESENPAAHNRRRGEFFYEPSDYFEGAPYSVGHMTLEAALKAAEEHERRRRDRDKNERIARGEQTEWDAAVMCLHDPRCTSAEEHAMKLRLREERLAQEEAAAVAEAAKREAEGRHEETGTPQALRASLRAPLCSARSTEGPRAAPVSGPREIEP